MVFETTEPPASTVVDTVSLPQLEKVVSTECATVEDPLAVEMALVLEAVLDSKQAVVITNEPDASLLETTVK